MTVCRLRPRSPRECVTSWRWRAALHGGDPPLPQLKDHICPGCNTRSVGDQQDRAFARLKLDKELCFGVFVQGAGHLVKDEKVGSAK